MCSVQILSTTINSITLSWNALGEDVQHFQLQQKNDVNKWITIYFGLKTQVTVKDLQPSESYHFQLGVTTNDGKLSSTLIAAVTSDQPLAVGYLHRAIEIGNLMKVRHFLKSRARVLEAYDSLGRSALMLATISGQTTIISLLLDNGANVNLQNSLGRTSLMIACSMGRNDIVHILLDRGAIWEIKDRNGCSAINYAADSSQLECLRIALDGGADIESRDNHQMTVLMRAVLVESSTEVVQELISRSAQVDASDNRHVTCLMLATLSNRSPVIELLIQAGAVKNQIDIYKNSALDMAKAKGNKEIIKVLRAQKEHIETADEDFQLDY